MYVVISKRMRHVRLPTAWVLASIAVLLGAGGACAQSNIRLLLEAGSSVPGHAGFAFGPFSNLAMNEAQEIVFLSTLRSAKNELRAVVRSTGVTFAVVAFEGLRSPVLKTTYESFSAPSLNNAGVIAFTATLKNEHPSSSVIRMEGAAARALTTTGMSVPGQSDATFLEFSAPIVNSVGNVLFAARTGGKQPGMGLFLWMPQGIQSVPVPREMTLSPGDLLTPVFFGHDAAVFASRQIPFEAVAEQFFRAAAIKSFEELKPPPPPAETFEVLPAHPGNTPIKMLLVLVEGGNAQTEMLQGDPTRAVKAKRAPGAALKPLGGIQGQATAPRGNIIFAGVPADQQTDLALYCLCDGQMIRLTTPEEFLPITQTARGKPLSSLVGDFEHTIAFIAPAGQELDAGAIYITSLP